MSVHPGAGKPADPSQLIDVDELVSAYYRAPPSQPVVFGTSGHRGSSFKGSFNEAHILATTQAICELRSVQGIDGPLFLGVDTHALSEPARVSALEVLAANGVDVRVDRDDGFTPTPVISHAILAADGADGIVITPSHNPPEDGGFKYNPPHGGPADTDVTAWVEKRANELLNDEIPRTDTNAQPYDYVDAYVSELGAVVDMDAIRGAGIRIGVDPLGGAGVGYWAPIAEKYKLDIEVVNDAVDPTFGFMTLDRDGKIRMDCSSPYAMAKLIELRDRFDIAFANDTDTDRHGIVTPSVGQVVRERSSRWFARLRRRGKRGGVLLETRRRRLDDGQGRHHHEPESLSRREHRLSVWPSQLEGRNSHRQDARLECAAVGRFVIDRS